MLDPGLIGQDLVPQVEEGVLPIACLYPARELGEVNSYLLHDLGSVPLHAMPGFLGDGDVLEFFSGGRRGEYM